MPKNVVSDPITDQEIAFARLVLSGTVSDQRAAEIAGLNPSTAAYTKAKPRVRAWMHENRASLQNQMEQQQADSLRRRNVTREQVLGRLWEIANLSPELTRGSINGQVKALSMIVAIEDLTSGRRAASAESKPVAQSRPSPNYPFPSSESAQAETPDPETTPKHNYDPQDTEPSAEDRPATPSWIMESGEPAFAHPLTPGALRNGGSAHCP